MTAASKRRTKSDTPIKLKRAAAAKELPVASADILISEKGLAFETTAEVEPLDVIVGQERAMEALDIGLGIEQEGYNIFVAGLTGTGKMGTIRRSLQQRTAGSRVPPDWVYVYNFEEPDCPRAISLKSGTGRKLQKSMEKLLVRLQEELPKAFRKEDFSHEKERLGKKYHARFQEKVQKLSEQAKDKDFIVRQSSEGNIVFIPLIEGKPAENQEQIDELSEEQKEKMDEAQHELAHEAGRLMEGQQELLGELADEVHQAERRFGEQVVKPLIAAIKKSCRGNKRVREYLDRVEEYTLDNLSMFRSHDHSPSLNIPGLALALGQERPGFTEYEVNVLVDHSKSEGAPIVVEESPTFRNLFGTIERSVDRAGHLVTNFTQIKSGSLLRASGGYLVFNLEDALTEPYVYKFLKRTLRSGMIHFETYDPWAIITAGGIRPEPIEIRTKVVVLGSPWLYYMLSFYDDEFPSIFKVKADFGTEMERGDEQQMQYARFIAMLGKEENLRPFARDAVMAVIRFSVRQTAHKKKLLTRFSEVADMLREANFVAAAEKADVVTAEHVAAAIKKRIYRSGRLEDKIHELISDGTILVNIEGVKVGQVNALAILDMGDYAFGRPNRVTSSLGLGTDGVINIEREAKLSGSTHDKGVLILGGYLRNKYGRDKPVAISASLCFEQSYSGVDGDSASSTELYALLSNLAEIPLRQDIAVTGSVNQWGEIQAIGGVNEKVEGFYDVCREVGMTGTQGVCIPVSNVKNLVLRDDVRDAIAAGKFHIYPIASIDQGLEVLSGVKAGKPDQVGTFHWVVDRQVRKMAEDLRNFGSLRESGSVLTSKPEVKPELPPKMPDETP
jgi:predicted ATP-dependent protease